MRPTLERYISAGTIVPTPVYDTEYIGPWRAQVWDNKDPLQLGRLQVIIPEVHGKLPYEKWVWPAGGAASGGKADDGAKWGTLFLPPVGAWVMVEFANGDAEEPRWKLGWFAQDETPDADDGRGGKILLTDYPYRWGTVDTAGNWQAASAKPGSEFYGVRSPRVVYLDAPLVDASGPGDGTKPADHKTRHDIAGGPVPTAIATAPATLAPFASGSTVTGGDRMFAVQVVLGSPAPFGTALFTATFGTPYAIGQTVLATAEIVSFVAPLTTLAVPAGIPCGVVATASGVTVALGLNTLMIQPPIQSALIAGTYLIVVRTGA